MKVAIKSQESILSRREAQPDEDDHDEMEVVNPIPELGLDKSRKIWSYKFSIKDIDDF